MRCADIRVSSENFTVRYKKLLNVHNIISGKKPQNLEVFKRFMRLNPGEMAPRTGNYNVVDANGEVVNSVFMNQGDTMPPTQSSDYHYED